MKWWVYECCNKMYLHFVFSVRLFSLRQLYLTKYCLFLAKLLIMWISDLICWFKSKSKLMNGKLRKYLKKNIREYWKLWYKLVIFTQNLTNSILSLLESVGRGLHPKCQTQIRAQGNDAHLSFLKSFPSAVTVSTGISSILMFPISDSLKFIFRERKMKRGKERREEKSNSGPAETLTWINQGNINT